MISRFSANLKPLPHATEDYDTVEVFFKQGFPDEWTSPLPHPHIARIDVAEATDELTRRLEWAEARNIQYQKLL